MQFYNRWLVEWGEAMPMLGHFKFNRNHKCKILGMVWYWFPVSKQVMWPINSFRNNFRWEIELKTKSYSVREKLYEFYRPKRSFTAGLDFEWGVWRSRKCSLKFVLLFVWNRTTGMFDFLTIRVLSKFRLFQKMVTTRNHILNSQCIFDCFWMFGKS